jgi:ABC-type multidrug transport system ATPase subunit
MQITLTHISKRFQRYWIFRDISYSFSPNNAYCLLGANGSGKSTLMRVIAGMQNPSKGKVQYTHGNGAAVGPTEIYKNISFCAPGMEIVEELTLQEYLSFHFSFKKPLPGLDIPAIIALTGLQQAADKPIGDYSSGMKQRVKLAQAIFADSPVLLLDEPCTNLDQQGVAQYREWMEQYAANRMVIVASNDPREYFFCKEQIVLEDYK